ATNRVYDATMNEGVTGAAALNAGIISPDVVNLIGGPVVAFTTKTVGTAKPSFNNKNAGVGKAVTVIGYTISNTDAANYNLSQPPGLTGTINPVPTSCVLVSSVNPSTNSQNVTFTATISANPLPVVPDAPTSTVSFSTNGIPQVSITVVSNAPGVAKAVWSTTGLYLGPPTVLAAY